MGKMKDIKDKRYGFLVAKSPTGKRINDSVMWKCICDCGNSCEVSVENLERHKTISCGCKRAERTRVLSKRDRLQNVEDDIHGQRLLVAATEAEQLKQVLGSYVKEYLKSRDAVQNLESTIRNIAMMLPEFNSQIAKIQEKQIKQNTMLDEVVNSYFNTAQLSSPDNSENSTVSNKLRDMLSDIETIKEYKQELKTLRYTYKKRIKEITTLKDLLQKELLRISNIGQADTNLASETYTEYIEMQNSVSKTPSKLKKQHNTATIQDMVATSAIPQSEIDSTVSSSTSPSPQYEIDLTSPTVEQFQILPSDIIEDLNLNILSDIYKQADAKGKRLLNFNFSTQIQYISYLTQNLGCSKSYKVNKPRCNHDCFGCWYSVLTGCK